MKNYMSYLFIQSNCVRIFPISSKGIANAVIRKQMVLYSGYGIVCLDFYHLTVTVR